MVSTARYSSICHARGTVTKSAALPVLRIMGTSSCTGSVQSPNSDNQPPSITQELVKMQALKTMKRTILAAAMALLAAPAWAGDSQPLRIGWVSAMANAPVLIAEKKGFFKEEGLAVELKSFGDGPVIQQAVASGDVDVAYVGAPPVYQWFARGLDSV